jgi:probable HAF family extracellular repeat protein
MPSAYAVTDLGTFPASDRNNAGQMVGQAANTDGFNHAFLWDNGTMIDLGTLGGTNSAANAINDLGQVVGVATTPGDAGMDAFLITPQGGVWFQDSDLDGRNDLMIDLGTLSTDSISSATHINNAGQVVGWGQDALGVSHAFLWDAVNGMTDLGVSAGVTSSYAYGINEAGQVTGTAYYEPLSGGGLSSAFLWDAANGMTVLGAGPTYADSEAGAINDAGQVVGYRWNDSGGGYAAYLWTPDSPNGLTGSFTDVGLLPGATNSFASAINNAGQVVGSTTLLVETEWGAYESTHAFLWDAAGGTVDLVPGFYASNAVAIYDDGAIWVSGNDGLGENRSYLLTPIPTVSIADASTVTEGNAGTVEARFTVNLSEPSTQTITVAYATRSDTATAGSDYEAQSGTLTFAPGETSKTLSVMVNGDRLGEPNETFFVNLSAPTNAAIADDQGIGTILDDEPRISINDAMVTEGNTGTRAMTFTVSLSSAYDAPVSVNWTTANGTATAGSDFQAASGTLTIPAGQTSGTIIVLVNSDRLVESNKNFFVNLSNLNYGVVADGQGVGTIVDDDPRVSINDVTKKEGNGNGNSTVVFTFTVTLSVAYDVPITLSFATADGTAKTSDNDYVANSGTITFAPGETSKTITVVVKGDKKKEGNENFFVDLSDLSGYAVFLDSRGTGTILNDD